MALINAAGVEDIEAIWATLLAKALEGKNVKDLLANVGSGGGAPATGGAPAAAAGGGGGAAAPAEEKKEEKKEEKEESDDDMVRFLLPSELEKVQLTLLFLFQYRVSDYSIDRLALGPAAVSPPCPLIVIPSSCFIILLPSSINMAMLSGKAPLLSVDW
ncbi:hypothetical protein FRB93_011245 [Tulasnella sp. JGI-2019a]|nr:hypothetical protein FRB93_011245 [Tulasnella sp. JGI-2019a]